MEKFNLLGSLGLDKISKKNSLAIIYSLLSLTKLGNSLTVALDSLSNMETGSTQKYLKTALLLIREKGYHVSKALVTIGVLNDYEFIILENAKDVKKSLQDIIDMREINGNFTKTLMKLTFFPALSVVIGLLIVYKVLPIFMKPMESINKIMAMKGISPTDGDGISNFFWYINYPDSILFVLVIYVALVALFYFSYFYLREKNPSFLYKINKLIAYDDIPFILLFMRSLNRTGMTPITIANVLSKSHIKSGWKPLFKNIKNGIGNQVPIYSVFENFHFPREVTLIIKSAEIGKSFWANIDALINYTVEKNETANNTILKYFGGLSTLIGYAIIIYFLMGIFIIMLQIQTVATSIMG